MEMDCNLKKLANLCIFQMSLKTDHSLFFLERDVNIFLLCVVRAILFQTRLFINCMNSFGESKADSP